jgi:hypothetical protein
LETIIIREFHATEAYSSLDLTKAKYRISRLSIMEKKTVIIRINPINSTASEKKNGHDNEKEIFSQYVHLSRSR